MKWWHTRQDRRKHRKDDLPICPFLTCLGNANKWVTFPQMPPGYYGPQRFRVCTEHSEMITTYAGPDSWVRYQVD